MPTFILPNSGGTPLVEVNRCHGKGRGHPCTGGGTGPGGSTSFADPWAASVRERPPARVPVVNPPKAEARFVKSRMAAFIARQYPGARVSWVRPLKFVTYPTGKTGWSGEIQLKAAGYRPTTALVSAEADGRGLDVRPVGV
jgi:hypothetical protein